MNVKKEMPSGSTIAGSVSPAPSTLAFSTKKFAYLKNASTPRSNTSPATSQRFACARRPASRARAIVVPITKFTAIDASSSVTYLGFHQP